MERRGGILLKEMDVLRVSVNGINHCLLNCFYLNFTQSPFYETTRDCYSEWPKRINRKVLLPIHPLFPSLDEVAKLAERHVRNRHRRHWWALRMPFVPFESLILNRQRLGRCCGHCWKGSWRCYEHPGCVFCLPQIPSYILK